MREILSSASIVLDKIRYESSTDPERLVRWTDRPTGPTVVALGRSGARRATASSLSVVRAPGAPWFVCRSVGLSFGRSLGWGRLRSVAVVCAQCARALLCRGSAARPPPVVDSGTCRGAPRPGRPRRGRPLELTRIPRALLLRGFAARLRRRGAAGPDRRRHDLGRHRGLLDACPRAVLGRGCLMIARLVFAGSAAAVSG